MPDRDDRRFIIRKECKMYYIKDYKETEKFTGVYLCRKKQILKTKTDKTYYSLELQDKTGLIDAKIWNLTNAINDFNELDFVKAEGLVTSFQGKLQVNIDRLRVAEPGEYDPKEYIPSTRYNTEELYARLLKYMNSVNNPYLKKLLEHFFVEDRDFIDRFKNHSAAKSLHHGFLGGLLQHSVFVAMHCDNFSKIYKVLDRDLLITCALLHDIGKIDELTDFPRNDYSDDGQMLGHIYMGAHMIDQAIDQIPDFPHVLRTEVIHCILAHHGEYEYGSPKKPCIAEALALNLADNVDAKMENMTELYDKAEPTLDWLGYQKFYENYIRQSSGTVEKRTEEALKKGQSS